MPLSKLRRQSACNEEMRLLYRLADLVYPCSHRVDHSKTPQVFQQCCFLSVRDALGKILRVLRKLRFAEIFVRGEDEKWERSGIYGLWSGYE